MRRILICAALVIAAIVGVSEPVRAGEPDPTCPLWASLARICPISVDAESGPDRVVLDANANPSNQPRENGQHGGGVVNVESGPRKPPPPREAVPGAEDTPGQDNFVPPVREQCTDTPDVCNPSLVISLNDIASFKASVPVLAQMQPSGWALKNLPMNLVASAAVEEISGELLGFPASVRFTPVSYAWDYGDGTSGTSVTGGASWEALGVPELTKTATSHVYRERGEYAVTVSVVLSAEYRFAGQPWRPIAGTLQIAGAASPVSVKTVRTVLVRGTCLQYPNDPGC